MSLKRGLSFILFLIMVLSFGGFSAFASENSTEEVVLAGDFAGPKGTVMKFSEGSVYSVTLDIEAGSYHFNVKHGDAVYGHPGTIKDSTSKVTDKGFLLSSEVNAKCTFVATGGSYTFSFDTETLRLKVTDGTETEAVNGETLTVNFGNGVAVAEVGDKLVYGVYLSADVPLEDLQTALSYNSDKLSLVKVSEEAENYPGLTDAVFNSDLQGVVTLNSTFIYGCDFTDEKAFLTLEFIVTESGETTLEFTVQEMTATDSTTYYTFSRKIAEGAKLREEIEVVPEPVDFAGCTITLTGQIAVNFHMEITEGVAADESAEMVFTLPNGGKKHIPIKAATVKDGNYVFTCQVAAKEMASSVKAQIVASDWESRVFRYSVKEYAEYILEKAKEESHIENEYTKAAPLVRAMLNYGASAQTFFEYNKQTLANDSLTADEKRLDEAQLSKYSYSLSGKEPGVVYYGSTLSLESETALKHYFYIEDETNIPEIKVNDKEATLTEVNGYYEVKIPEILAQNLDEKIIVTVGGITLDYNAFSYGQLALQDDNANLKNVINALYAYNQAAKAY